MGTMRVLKKGVAALVLVLFVAPAPLLASKPKKTIPIRISINIDWNHKGSGNTRSIGTYRVNVRGKATFKEKGEHIKYEPAEIVATGHYTERRIMEKPGSKCHQKVISRIEASGTVPITSSGEGALDGSGGSLILSENLGHLGTVAAMQYQGQFNRDAMLKEKKDSYDDNYSAFLVAGFRAKIKDGLCDGPAIKKEGVIPIALTIFKELSPSGMQGSYIWKAKSSFGPPSKIYIGDFHGDKRLSPRKGQGARYRVSWTFKEIPAVRIWRDDKDITDKNIEVKAGERMELECKVIPKSEPAPQSLQWTIDDGKCVEQDECTEQDKCKKQYKCLKEFKADKYHGKVLDLTDADLRSSKIVFYWAKDGNRKATCEVVVKGRKYIASTEFSIRRPQFEVKVTPKEGSTFKIIDTEGAPSSKDKECWQVKPNKDNKNPDETKDSKGLKGLQYDGIDFECISSDSGEFQWVQLVLEDKITYTNFSGLPYGWILKGLDTCYPYQKGKKTRDKPALPIHRDYLNKPENSKNEDQDLKKMEKSLTCNMYLMYRPEGKGNTWVPIHVVDWRWQGSIKNEGKYINWEKDYSTEPKTRKGEETSTYPEWSTNRADENADNIIEF